MPDYIDCSFVIVKQKRKEKKHTMEHFRVLVVDDHYDFRRLVLEYLRRLPNIEVVEEAADGKEAIEKAEELEPDFVLMDISMPNTNGLEATKIIKQRLPETKVLITTNYDTPVYRSQALEVKADGFILKSSLKPGLDATFGVSSVLRYNTK